MSDELRLLVTELLTHGWRVKLVEHENGTCGFALLLDGWYKPGVAGINLEGLEAYWQDVVDRLCDAADVPVCQRRDNWAGIVRP
jgi:hypothetical protein